MIAIATISDPKRLALILDLDSRKVIDCIPVQEKFIDSTVVGRPQCRPFGITWTENELFVANNNQLISFDKSLNFKYIISNALEINVHQLAYREGRVWAVSPWTNSLIGLSTACKRESLIFCLLTHKFRKYNRYSGAVKNDIAHFNSLLWGEESFYVTAHAFGEGSFIISYDAVTGKPLCLYEDVGKSIHGIACCDRQPYWLSTGTLEIRSNCGLKVPVSQQGYLRGFAVTDQYFVVGISQFLSRNARVGGDSWIQVIERRNLSLESEIHLKDTGSLNVLRLLDIIDYAHFNFCFY